MQRIIRLIDDWGHPCLEKSTSSWIIRFSSVGFGDDKVTKMDMTGLRMYRIGRTLGACLEEK